MSNLLKIKVCGMRDAANIIDLVNLDIDYIGFIFYAKSSRIVKIRPDVNIPKNIQKVGVFVNANQDEIAVKSKDFDLQIIQLHGDESPDFCLEIKKMGLEIFKAFGIDDDFDWKILELYQGKVDYFLFDTKSKLYGGTGQTFNWQKLKDYPYNTPYWLSGGLSVDNIEEAANFEDHRLYGLDLNSKFEKEPAFKDINKLKTALTRIKK